MLEGCPLTLPIPAWGQANCSMRAEGQTHLLVLQGLLERQAGPATDPPGDTETGGGPAWELLQLRGHWGWSVSDKIFESRCCTSTANPEIIKID